MSRWYYTLDNKQRLGPVTFEALRLLARSGELRPEHMVMRERQLRAGKWVPAGKLKGLFTESDPPPTVPDDPAVARVPPAAPTKGVLGSLFDQMTQKVQALGAAVMSAV